MFRQPFHRVRLLRNTAKSLAVIPSSETRLGCAELDLQHEQLGEKLLRFTDLTVSHASRIEAIDLLRELIMDTGLHFGYEESLMKESDYPDFDHHFRQHAGMMTELGLLLERLHDSAGSQTVRHAVFLHDWYRRHFDISDRKLVEWLKR